MSEPELSVWQVIGAGVAAAVTGALGWAGGRKTRAAAQAAEVAELGVGQAHSRAEADLYTLLTTRLAKLEGDVLRLNTELDAERTLRRAVENHVSTLERLMRLSGLNPPAFGISEQPQ